MLRACHLEMVTFRPPLGDMVPRICHRGQSYSEVQLGLSEGGNTGREGNWPLFQKSPSLESASPTMSLQLLQGNLEVWEDVGRRKGRRVCL